MIMFMNVLLSWALFLPGIVRSEDNIVEHVDIVKGSSMMSVRDYWPEVSEDLTLVQWKHSINTKELLVTALEDNTMMIGADITIDKDKQTVMKNSTFKLENFMDSVIKAIDSKNVKKGLKFNFASVDAVEPALKVIASYEDKITFPLWLQANIIAGPGSDVVPVDPDQFLSLCSKYLPWATLSVGWTTGPKGNYEDLQLGQMVDLMTNVNVSSPSPTLELRASLITETDTPRLSNLIVETEVAGAFPEVYVWDESKDKVDMKQLDTFVELVGKNRVYLDVPWATGKSAESSRLNVVAAICCILPALFV